MVMHCEPVFANENVKNTYKSTMCFEFYESDGAFL